MTSHGYPLVIFGITDIQGKFHPVVFMLTSHEKRIDFHHLYSGLVKIAEEIEINFDPKFIMQDACKASYNAAKAVFGEEITILMCYYHVKANLLKNKHLLTNSDFYEEFEEDVTKLHRATTEIVYNERLAEFKKKYKVSQKKMFSYFETQWLTGSFDKWQIFRNSPGFANTNSNIESFNATFKRDFTKRIKGSMLCSLNKLFTCIIYYSQPLNNVWFVCPAFDEDIKRLASKLEASCFTKMGKSGKKFRYTKTGDTGVTHDIRTDDTRCYKSCSCDCSSFIKWALCSHIVAYSNKFLLDIYGKEYRQAKNFVAKSKKGAKPKLNRTGRFSKSSTALNY